jgi:signal transduction histidine kinase
MTCDSLREDGSIHFRAITESTGLLSNYIASIYSDRSGKLWFGTDKGVSKFDGHNFQNMLLGDDFVFRSIENIFEDRNGAIWLTGTNSGVIRYTPPAQEIHPRILITQIETDKIYTEQVEAVDIPSDRRLSIAYKAISFKTNPKLMRFQYMLEGHDAGWQASTFETRVHYEELKPATYLFKVRAIDEDLHYSSPPASVNIAVFRPMYLNPWVRGLFLAGGIAAIAGTIYLIVQLKRHRQIAADFREKLHLQKEAERIQRAKMQSLSQLVAGVAHEINNPIGVIAGNNDVINRVALKIKDSLGQNIEDGSLRKAFSILETTNRASKTASDRLAKIVTNLRKFVRLDEAEWQTADIHEGIDSAIALLEAGMPKSIIFDRRYGSLQPAYCSPSSLNQAFMTILRNAADAITEKGKITIKTEMADGRLRIDISDDGIGIPPENLGRIFDPGFTTKGVKVGVGLGLSICYKILVEEHNGHIDVDSEVGKGTTFTVTLPLRSGPKE